MKKLSFLLLAVIFLAGNAWSQTAPTFKYEIGGKIEKMTLTDAGVLLVNGSSGLSGIRPGASSPHFSFAEYGKIKEEEMELVPLSPYIILTQGGASQIPGTIFANSKRTVIDVITGEKVFVTEENGWKQIAQLKIFLPENKVVVVGNREKREEEVLAVGIYDLASGKQEGFAKLDPNIGKVRSGAAIPMSSGAPFLLQNQVFVPTTKGVICANVKDGGIIWQNEIKNVTSMIADNTGNEIYGFEERSNGDTRIHKFGKDGRELWDKERKIKGSITRFQILPQGLAIVSDVFKGGSSLVSQIGGSGESKIAFLDASNGEDLWEKAPKTKGYVQHFYVMEDGILFGIAEGGINKIKFDGTPLFKKPIDTGANIHTMATTPQGMIYITDTDANIINLTTGDSKWKKGIQYKKATAVTSAYDAAKGRYLISTGEEILAIDENTGDLSTLAKFKFDGKESPYTMGIRSSGIYLASDQNMMLLNSEGKENYHVFHKAPGQSTFAKVALGALSVASAAVSAAAASQSTYSYYIGEYNSADAMRAKNNAAAAESFANIASVSYGEMTKRFKATMATANDQFILTDLSDGVGLVKVNKDSGKTEKEIILKDKKPVYEVDDIEGYLYYLSGNGVISAFDLKK
ncbi:Outer membrane protein assembly factor BamB, contains PQQ-like beta-propeller repeat [Algoriphagus ornithinivorans]|uniref:Outer membrane protein assembly factor BamB, contains PQQ-like beta-propeller repeat n=1 Tax=Algoriphagus ornithinivorans TaxID=226506 RepID=A0A1I5F3J0_9BACT|nr:PQQ-binding-like beta-propeller repeat protein [Algoriphagus ornithinivorans]SFO18368.1 Outer membrane protein assembly factor BamB, contains PQQ-like beta-propeller repeat [Algoriphagus ornithinivorans]